MYACMNARAHTHTQDYAPPLPLPSAHGDRQHRTAGGRGEDMGMGQDTVHIEPTLRTVATELHLLLVLEHYNGHVVWVSYLKCTH